MCFSFRVLDATQEKSNARFWTWTTPERKRREYFLSEESQRSQVTRMKNRDHDISHTRESPTDWTMPGCLFAIRLGEGMCNVILRNSKTHLVSISCVCGVFEFRSNSLNTVICLRTFQTDLGICPDGDFLPNNRTDSTKSSLKKIRVSEAPPLT